ncbi:hypothetical protein [uncultured Tessaracoccus sp.]|uniref:hypothetical protein n=1 Tax=uncultured Tessaracoccus sp. TaxID=905023 RepID=UPI0025EC621C|nr:hypothetical protein [uncultured Tessaracoccus sp.]
MLTFTPLDVDDDEALRNYGALAEASDEATLGGSAPKDVPELRAALQPNEYRGYVIELLHRDREAVGFLNATLPQRENADQFQAYPVFRPDLMDDEALHLVVADRVGVLAREHGRRPTMWMLLPADGDPDDPALPANRAAARLGLRRRSLMTCTGAPLPLAEHLLAERVDVVDGYRIDLWQGPVAREWVEPLLTLYRRFDADIPIEDQDRQAPVRTEERLRTAEAWFEAQRIEIVRAVAIAPDGTLAGLSEVEVGARGSLAFQETTVVLTEHRGYGLGRALKLATHAELSRRERLTSIVTWTSHVNPWMNAINDELGYRIRHREGCYQG